MNKALEGVALAIWPTDVRSLLQGASLKTGQSSVSSCAYLPPMDLCFGLGVPGFDFWAWCIGSEIRSLALRASLH